MKKIIIILSIILVALAASTTTLAIMFMAQKPADRENVKEEAVVKQPEEPTQPAGAGESVTIEVGGTEEQANDYISRQAALNVALQNLGVTINDVRDVDMDLEYKFGKVFYEVDLEYGKYEYEYHIDPTSGAVLKIFKEVIY